MNLNRHSTNFSRDIDRMYRQEFQYRQKETIGNSDLDFLIFTSLTTSCLGMRRLVDTEFERLKYGKP